MKYINGKKLLWKAKGEYNDYAVDHVIGCRHGCRYPCYAMKMAIDSGQIKTIKEWENLKIIENSMELLEKEIPKFKHDIKSVFLCFCTDPFMYGDEYDEIRKMSYEIIKFLNQSNIECTILTKGILPIELANLSEINNNGITFNTTNGKFQERIEPYASPISERLKALYDLHKLGMKTWISMEPYPSFDILNQSIDDVLDAVHFVDKIVFGCFDSDIGVMKYKNFFSEIASRVIEFCEKTGKQYYIKKGIISEEALVK